MALLVVIINILVLPVICLHYEMALLLAAPWRHNSIVTAMSAQAKDIVTTYEKYVCFVGFVACRRVAPLRHRWRQLGRR